MKHIHLIGIGGTGLSAIARVLLEMGYTVSGSDRIESPFARDLQSMGVTVHFGHYAENVTGADLVVRSSAIPDDNPEVKAAKASKIPVLKRAEFLGNLLDGKTVIAVAGTHGKTTTTAMIAWMLMALNLEPSFIVGGVLANLGTNARYGKGKYFVIEADEYDRMFLGLYPSIEVITNLEHDHPDCYPTFKDMQAAFIEFVGHLMPEGTLIACAEDAGAIALINKAKSMSKKVLAYSFEPKVSARKKVASFAEQVKVNETGNFSFHACVHENVVPVQLQIPGRHNVLNALAALTVAYLLNEPLLQAAEALGRFTGTGRRFEIKGTINGITIIDDYAHHPTEIRATLAAAKARFPGSRLWAVWQPHTYSRTKLLLRQFANSFDNADEVIVTEVYPAREPKQDFSAKKVVEIMHRPTFFARDLSEAFHILITHLQPGDVLLVLSAGDADQISAMVLAHLQEVSNA